jgi:AcrR family transcriptional regulator
MPKRPDSGNAREHILDAANAVVAIKGVSALTLEEVAREAGFSKGGVLYHFPSKDALTAAMIERFISRFDQAMADEAARDPERRGSYTRAYVKVSMGDIPGGTDLIDRVNGSLTAALANYPERLAPVREQSARSQRLVANDGLDPILASIIRFAIDGMWLGENFNLIRIEPKLKAAITKRLLAWTRERETAQP